MFNSPKLAGEIGSFIQTIGVLFYYYLNTKKVSKWIINMIFILP